MEKKQIQEKRMRGYFIESAKNLLKSEGLKSISVRHVADHAGYSYATLYNYFKDINELIFHCVDDFQKECAGFVKSKTRKAGNGKNKLKAITKAYIEYFIEYPGVFELFFLERMGNIGNKTETSQLIYNLLDSISEDQWNTCVREGLIDENNAKKLKDQLRYITVGLMIYYENRHQPEDYKEFIKMVDEQIDGVLDF